MACWEVWLILIVGNPSNTGKTNVRCRPIGRIGVLLPFIIFGSCSILGPRSWIHENAPLTHNPQIGVHTGEILLTISLFNPNHSTDCDVPLCSTQTHTQTYIHHSRLAYEWPTKQFVGQQLSSATSFHCRSAIVSASCCCWSENVAAGAYPITQQWHVYPSVGRSFGRCDCRQSASPMK